MLRHLGPRRLPGGGVVPGCPVAPTRQLLTRDGEEDSGGRGSGAAGRPAQAWSPSCSSSSSSSRAICCPRRPARWKGPRSCRPRGAGAWPAWGGCRLRAVSGSHVGCSPRPHLCIPSTHRSPRTTMGTGPSEPYLLFLRKSLLAFCNCTVDKRPKSP